MIDWFDGGIKVTHCIIQIQEHLDETHPVQQWTEYNHKTAVSKYFIGISSIDIPVMNKYILFSRGFTSKAYSKYPLIRINRNGFKAVKCPTVSG